MSLQSEEQQTKSETLNDKLDRILVLLEQIAENTKQTFFVESPPQFWTDGVIVNQDPNVPDNPPPNTIICLDEEDLPKTPFIGEIGA